LPSGIYVAHVVDATDTTKTLTAIPFTVRDDRRTSSLLVEADDTTWQAYNIWGDACNLPGIGGVYVGPPPNMPGWDQGIGGRIVKARFDRPYQVGADSEGYASFVYDALAPYVEFFEHIGADVSYITARDVGDDWAHPQAQSLLLSATGANRVFVLTEHDEYWSQERRNNIDRARRAGVHVMFLTGNDIAWRTRTISSDEFDVYKESSRHPPLGVQATWTGLWGDPRYERSTAGDATGPENATSGMVGGAWSANYHYEVLVSDEESRHRFWRGTPYQNGGTVPVGVANLDVINDEWNRDGDNGFRPPGLVYLSTTPTVGNYITMGQPELAARSRYTSQITHHMIMFRDPSSHAITFHAGTTDFGNAFSSLAPCSGGPDAHLEALQRGVVNLMADMGLSRPDRLPCDAWWTPPPALPALPSGTVANPGPLMMGRSVELSGSATAFSGATVASVEVGIRPQGTTTMRYAVAAGRSSWISNWTPPAPGTYELQARVTDDRGQIGTSAVITVTVSSKTRMYTDGDTFSAFSSYDLAPGLWRGTQFRTAVTGTVAEIRIWMPDAVSHAVRLVDLGTWHTMVAAATETKAGWRSAVFAPVTLQPNHNYAVLMWVPTNALYPFVPTSQYSPTADAPPLRSVGGLVGPASEDWTQLTGGSYGIPADVVFDAPSYWSTASLQHGWYESAPAVDLWPSSLEQRIGVTWTPASDGYVDGLRVIRPAGDTNDYLVELLAGPSMFLADVPALLSAGAIRQGASAVTFDTPIRVFRGHAYRAVIHVVPGGHYPRASTPPALTPWLSSVSQGTNICNRNVAYNICDPDMKFSTTSTADPAAIDVLFRPTASFRQSLWPRTGVTPMEPVTAGSPGTVGIVWQTPAAGYVEGIRFFDTASEPGTKVRLFDATAPCAPGTPADSCPALICMATGTPVRDASSWYGLRFEHPCAVVANHKYIASVFLPSGRRARTDQYFQCMDPGPGHDPLPSARNLYEDGFLVASSSAQSTGDTMPAPPSPVDCTTPQPVGDRSTYFVEPILRDGR